MDQQKLIALLMQREFISGEWIAAGLGADPADVEKAVEALRRAGRPVDYRS